MSGSESWSSSSSLDSELDDTAYKAVKADDLEALRAALGAAASQSIPKQATPQALAERACQKGAVRCASWLIANQGINPNSLLERCVWAHRPGPMLHMLARHGVLMDQRSVGHRNARTPAGYAADLGMWDALSWLLQHRARVRAVRRAAVCFLWASRRQRVADGGPLLNRDVAQLIARMLWRSRLDPEVLPQQSEPDWAEPIVCGDVPTLRSVLHRRRRQQARKAVIVLLHCVRAALPRDLRFVIGQLVMLGARRWSLKSELEALHCWEFKDNWGPARTRYGTYSCLGFAIRSPRSDQMVATLLDEQPDIALELCCAEEDFCAKETMAPLFYAVACKQLNTVKLLLRAGASPTSGLLVGDKSLKPWEFAQNLHLNYAFSTMLRKAASGKLPDDDCIEDKPSATAPRDGGSNNKAATRSPAIKRGKPSCTLM
jgi:hypothetical protein